VADDLHTGKRRAAGLENRVSNEVATMAGSLLARVFEPPHGPNGYPLVGIAHFVSPAGGYLLMSQLFELLPDGGLLVTLRNLDGGEEAHPVHPGHLAAHASPASWARNFAERVVADVDDRFHNVELVWRGALAIKFRGEPATTIVREVA
jgi:hypothetical protein